METETILAILVGLFGILTVVLASFLIIAVLAFKNVLQERDALQVLIINFLEGKASLESFKQVCKNLNIYSEPETEEVKHEEVKHEEVWDDRIYYKDGK